MSNPTITKSENDESFESIEQLIFTAKDYLVPSDDLRPRTLEAAHEVCQVKRAERKLGGFVLTSVCFCLLTLPVVDCLVVWRTRCSMPSAQEMEYRALQIPQALDSNPSWNLMQAFEQLRQVQASNLNFGN